MHMVRLLHLHVILWELVHDARQIAVHGAEYRHANREVRGPKQRLALRLTLVSQLLLMVREPPCAPRHHLHASRKRPLHVAVRHAGSRELYRHVSAAERLALEVLRVIDVDAAHDVVSALQSYLLYHVAHFTVADECYLH